MTEFLGSLRAMLSSHARSQVVNPSFELAKQIHKLDGHLVSLYVELKKAEQAERDALANRLSREVRKRKKICTLDLKKDIERCELKRMKLQTSRAELNRATETKKEADAIGVLSTAMRRVDKEVDVVKTTKSVKAMASSKESLRLKAEIIGEAIDDAETDPDESKEDALSQIDAELDLEEDEIIQRDLVSAADVTTRGAPTAYRSSTSASAVAATGAAASTQVLHTSNERKRS
jgi:hypothetical protein